MERVQPCEWNVLLRGLLLATLCFAAFSCGGKKGSGDDCASNDDCGSGLVCEKVGDYDCRRVCFSAIVNPGNCAGR